MSVRVHVLGADPGLAPHLRRIEAAAAAATELVSRHLPLSYVDVVLERNPFATIPHLGIGGFSPSGHLVHVALDPTHAGFPELLDLHLSRTLAHELHHCARWRGPGYGRTLGETLVSEGLADHFDLQVHPDAAPYPWTQALDAAALREALTRAHPRLWDTDNDHAYWFFNTTQGGPPYRAGLPPGRGVPERQPGSPSGRPGCRAGAADPGRPRHPRSPGSLTASRSGAPWNGGRAVMAPSRLAGRAEPVDAPG